MSVARAVALVLVLVTALGGCRVMERISEGAFRNAVESGTDHELRARGVRVADLRCDFPSTVGGDVLHIRCHGRTDDGRPIAVTGTASGVQEERPRQVYVITVGGRIALRTDCLGPDCRSSCAKPQAAGTGRTPT